MSQNLFSEVSEQGVGRIVLNRPEKRNAFDDGMIHDLQLALSAMAHNPRIRVVTLEGAGEHFCAGGDIAWMREAGERDLVENLDDARRLASLMQTLDLLEKPTVALPHGAVYGGGVGLVACCDLVIARDDAAFCLSEVRLGILPAVIAPYVMRAIGLREARRYLLSAEVIDASTAKRIGLAHEVATAQDFPGVKARILRALLAGAPQAQAAAKSLLNFCSHRSIDETLIERTARTIAEARASQEGREGMSAFLEKRRPLWNKTRDA